METQALGWLVWHHRPSLPSPVDGGGSALSQLLGRLISVMTAEQPGADKTTFSPIYSDEYLV